MQEEYWDSFKNSGKITDYLYYKGMGICERVMNKYSGDTCNAAKIEEKASESNNSNGNGNSDGSSWRI